LIRVLRDLINVFAAFLSFYESGFLGFCMNDSHRSRVFLRNFRQFVS
jgi:hypothetical protein